MRKLIKTKGFTLVELIISVGLFVTVVTISLGAVLGVFDANNKAQSIASVMNNLNYSLDSMARDIRFSEKYHCGSEGVLTDPNPCSSGDTTFAVSSSTDLIVYDFNGSTIEKSVNGATPVPVIGGEVTITDAKFYIFNTSSIDSKQPYMILVIKGYAGKKDTTKSEFDLETLISQRPLDL